MNTLGLLQSKWSPNDFTLPLHETQIHDSTNIQKNWIYYLYLYSTVNILYIEIINNLGNKTVFYLIFVMLLTVFAPSNRIRLAQMMRLAHTARQGVFSSM